MIKKPYKIVLNVAVFVICVVLIIKKVDIPNVMSLAGTVDFRIFIFTVSISILRTWLSGIRWELLHPNNIGGMSKWAYFRLSMLSHLFNLFMPGALGGDIVKTAYAFNEGQGQKVKKVIAVFVDRTIGLISIMVLGMIALIASHKQLPINLWQAVLLFFASGGFMILLLSDRVLTVVDAISRKMVIGRRFIDAGLVNWRESVSFYKDNSHKVLSSLALCAPIHLVSFTIYYVLAISIGMNIGFMEMVFAIAIMWLITAVPISVGGMGVRELSLVWLLGIFGVSSEQAVSLALLGYVNAIIKSSLALPLLFDFRKVKPTGKENGQ